MDLDNPPSSSAQLQEASPEAQDILVPSDRYASTRRPTESIADFVARLPPVPTAARAVASPWYWVYGPTPTCTSTSSGSSSNNVPESVRAIAFRRQGERLLGRIKFGLDCNPGDARVHARLRAELQREIAALAREHGVTSGKWMLFPTVADVTSVWRAVAEAVVAGRLGTGAKVSTAGEPGDDGNAGGPGSSSTRLICVYTRDFTDVADVRRVLLALDAMGLVPRHGQINYKCDAYTYLGIYRDNEFQLPASIYRSRDLLGPMGGGGLRP